MVSTVDVARRKLVAVGFGSLSLMALSGAIPGLLKSETWLRPATLPLHPAEAEVKVSEITGEWPDISEFGQEYAFINSQSIAQAWQQKWPSVQEVAPLFVSQLPKDMRDVESKFRKELFFMIVTPLALLANHIIMLQRDRMKRILASDQYSESDHQFLLVLGRRMNIKVTDKRQINRLLEHIDIIPVSLVLAQGAIESGWGTSRFAREGNALFGVWTWAKGKGIVPHGRAEGHAYEVKRYDNLFQSVTDYIDNLNRHNAYAPLRQIRANARYQNKALTGYDMSGGLERYSQKGADYITSLRTLITYNNIDRIDRARLII